MTARAAAAAASLLALTVSACTNFYEVPIETPIQPKMDVSAFQRVLIAGFLAGGSEDVDANLETVRLLRSQLRSKSGLRVIDADVLPLMELAVEQRGEKPEAPPPADAAAPAGTEGTNGSTGTNGPTQAAQPPAVQPPAGDAQPPRIKDEKDLEPLETIFANVDYWKKIGEEFQNPLIVTGSVLFTPHARSGFVQREQEYYDTLGRRRVVPVRTYMERKGFILRPKFIFIDGRTGATLYSETFREEILYSPQQSTPALSSYFELMDRLVPSFLSTLSSQKIRGSRVLLK
ncbi:MAG: hypothetical protein JJE40_02920 [Vicinamibacteria bacterium]|nr:hypothetical protein [Vicinamibacteria bacterium]